MSASSFKAQAERLAAHLATKHGIKLKSSSMLEAIAAAHGARDWNTLAAGPSLAAPSPGLTQDIAVPAGELSPEEGLFQEVLRTGSLQMRFFNPKNPEESWRLEYGTRHQRAHLKLSPERGESLRRFLLSLAQISIDANAAGQLRFSRFSYRYGATEIVGLLRVICARSWEKLIVDLGEDTSPADTVRRYSGIEPLAREFTVPAARGLFVIAGITESLHDNEALALATLSPAGGALETHDYTGIPMTDVLAHTAPRWPVLGELREPAGVQSAAQLLEAGNLLLSTVHGNNIASAIRRLQGLGATSEMLVKHLRGIVAVRRLAKTCPDCHGVGCKACKERGTLSSIKVYEHVVVRSAQEAAALLEGRLSYPTMRGAAQKLVDAGEVSQKEFQRVFGE